MLQQGQKAPEFELLDQESKTHKLPQYLGKWVVLYFYPKDETPGCTIEACSFRDNFLEFKDLGIVVLGVSIDNADSHKEFAEKFNLPFPLLADTQKEVVEAYGVGGGFEGGAKRTTFLINKDGNIVKVYENVNPEIHVAEIIKDITELQK